METISDGLEGVVVAETRLSHVDGAAGRLVIAGLDVETLAREHTFASAAGLLWGEAPGAVEARLGRGRAAAFELLPRLGDALDRRDGMDALRAALAHLEAADGGGDPAAVTGAAATFAAAWARARAGQAPLAPDAGRGHAADYLRMATGADEARAARALDAYLTTVMDHGMNASTFTARVVASTGSDLVSAVVAGLGALKGPLHGGAPGPVLDMLDAVGEPAAAPEWIAAELAAGRRIMGMGHRVYRVRDPRAAVFERQVEALAADAAAPRLAVARAVEQAATAALAARHPGRALRANVEFYTALLLEAVGLPRAAFAPTFAVGRVVGWCAHVAEQRRVGRLIRPRARYVGPMPGR